MISRSTFTKARCSVSLVLVGAGRSELGAALFGLDRLEAGDILIKGRKVKLGSPSAAIAHGIGLVPEDRKLQGLMMQMSVLENSALCQSWTDAKVRLYQTGRESRQAAEPIYQQLRLKSCVARICRERIERREPAEGVARTLVDD